MYIIYGLHSHTGNGYKRKILVLLRVPDTPNWISFPKTFEGLPGKNILFVDNRVVQPSPCPLGLPGRFFSNNRTVPKTRYLKSFNKNY